MFLDIIPPKEITFPTETLDIPTNETIENISKSSFLENNGVTLVIAGLLILAVVIIILTKTILKKELQNA